MTTKIFINIIFLTLSVSLFSQNTKIDSLEQKVTQTKGNERILVLNDLAYAYGYVDFNKSISLAKEALLLAETQKYNKAMALTYDILGRAYFISGNYKVAEEYYNKCIETANKYGTKDDIYKALRHKILLIYRLIGQNGYEKDSTESIQTFKRYIDLTIEKNDVINFQEGLQFYIYVFYYQRSNSSMIDDYFAELKNIVKNNNEFLASIYANEGLYYKLKQDYFRAIEKDEQAIKLTKKIAMRVTYLERVGIIYFELKKYNESVKYLNEALKLINSNEFESKYATKCLVELDLGSVYYLLRENKTAIFYLQKVLKYPFLTKRDMGTVYNNLGQAYLSIDSIDKADYYINKALFIYDSLNINYEKLGVLHSKAIFLTRKQQWSQLSGLINEISVLANDVEEYYILFDCYQLLSDYYEKSGNYKKSNEYLKKWIAVNDSINNRDFVNKISELRFKYETEKKEQQIIMQQSTIKQKNKLIVLSFISGSLILVAFLVIFILYRIRNNAYKLLVYQSLKNTSNAPLVKTDDNSDEENTNEIRYHSSALDEELKNQIEILLNKQLELKMFGKSDITLKILSENCNTNRTYLSQFINEQYNTNFNTFINTHRINEAKLILSDRNNDIPLKELYLRLGFNSYSVFNEAFKKNVGVTPYFYLKTVKELFDVSK